MYNEVGVNKKSIVGFLCYDLITTKKTSRKGLTMDQLNHNIKSDKNKHLDFKERLFIQIKLGDGYSGYKIAKELERPCSTIYNEIERGTTTQIKNSKKIKLYLAETGQAVYKRNRSNSKKSFKILECKEFIDHVGDKFKNCSWSLDACVGNALVSGEFERSRTVCTKTLYNYIDLGLLSIRNIHLPMKLRRSTKRSRVRKNKRILGASIEERPKEIDSREEFGHWEIDTVIGEKTSDDKVLLTLVERKTRYSIVISIGGKTAYAVTEGIKELKELYGDKFSKVFKSITSDNGSEFTDLSSLEEEVGTKVYFTHPYSSYERGTNERHNGLIRRFIPKGKRMSDYCVDKISAIEEWMNTLPRKILGYLSPEYLFEKHLDEIYATQEI